MCNWIHKIICIPIIRTKIFINVFYCFFYILLISFIRWQVRYLYVIFISLHRNLNPRAHTELRGAHTERAHTELREDRRRRTPHTARTVWLRCGCNIVSVQHLRLVATRWKPRGKSRSQLPRRHHVRSPHMLSPTLEPPS